MWEWAPCLGESCRGIAGLLEPRDLTFISPGSKTPQASMRQSRTVPSFSLSKVSSSGGAVTEVGGLVCAVGAGVPVLRNTQSSLKTRLQVRRPKP